MNKPTEPKDIEKSESTEDKKKKKHRVLKIAGVVALVIIIILLLLRGCGPANTPAPIVTPNTWSTNIDEELAGKMETMSPEEIVAQLNKIVEESMVTISMNLSPKVENGVADLQIHNDPSNRWSQIVQIKTAEGEVVYTSGIIPVDGRINKATLDLTLAPGAHNCTASFISVNDEGVELYTSIANVTLNIKS